MTDYLRKAKFARKMNPLKQWRSKPARLMSAGKLNHRVEHMTTRTLFDSCNELDT